VVRTFISLPAGYARMRPVRFGVYTAAGCVPWIGGLAWAGYAAGANWQRVQRLVNGPAYVIAGLIGLLVIAVIIGAIVRRRKRAPEHGTEPADTPEPVSSSKQRRTN
jgi:membrane protein DedA with SNARE-associated domain